MTTITNESRPEPPFLPRRCKEVRAGEVLRAARDVFVERGFAAARIEDIAAKAGVSKGTVYLYFDSKEALFKAVVEDGLAPVIEAIETLAKPEANASRPARELLCAYLDVLQGIMSNTDMGSILKLLVAEAGNFREVVAWFNGSVVERARQAMANIVEAGIASGDFCPDNRTSLPAILFSPIFLCAFAKVMDDRSLPEHFLSDAYAFLTRGLARKHEPPAPYLAAECRAGSPPEMSALRRRPAV